MEDINRMLVDKPSLFIVECKKTIKKGKIGTEYICKSEYGLNGGKRGLIYHQMPEQDPKEFLDKLIEWHLEGDKIIEAYKGNRDLLPIRFRKFHDECVTFSTDKYQIYFNDKAIKNCSDIIFKLSERSKIDSFNFVKGKLESKEAKHMQLSLSDGFAFQKGRYATFVDEEEALFDFFPKKSVHYSANLTDNGTFDEDDINNILNLMEEFTKTHGLFSIYKCNNNELVAYNEGSLKICGIDKDERLKNKVYELMKKER